MNNHTETQAVAVRQSTEVAPAQPQPTVTEMLSAVIHKGVTAESVEAVKAMAELYERDQQRQAERAFASAFVALQADMTGVKAVRPVPNNDGSIRYRFAPFEEIMKVVGPLLKTHGFTVTFSTDYKEGRLIKLCTLQHVGGHSKTNQFAVRIGSGPPKASECQADGAASTYAKRFALCDALNIQIDHDTDAAAEGGAITADQAADLRRRVRETGADEARFLKFAGAPTFEDIPSAKYALLDENLRKKERTV